MALIVPHGMRYNKKTKKVESIDPPPKFEFTFPEGFVLVRDTREQVGLFLKPPPGLLIVRDTVPIAGPQNRWADYTVKGLEDRVIIEHKEIDDLWTSVTVNGAHFREKLEAMAKYERKYLIITGLESEYLAFRPGRKIHPNQIRQALASIEGRIGVPVHQSENTQYAERWLLDMLIKFYCEKRGI
jgi:ERCC4-type nuclease